ncbi:protein SLX4IP [Syngnathoides biaculeatus]|uniref:protein SLX4IP n=1 Tax=Syngnathoides biaculeatus TaxID=300417 RepID=UPI002ADD663E|nr:protein SLX4IP [Syngnathoides biaculeatus]XP_061694025.1 protein SLX4IP [Syngnathoides biaculeatus]
MAPLKFVIKCGNFAVLVDLHILPLSSQEDTSWFTTSHIEEVTTLFRDAVEQRVKQYKESFQRARQTKHKKELTPASAFVVKGKHFNIVANFLKRYTNLRCVVKQHHVELCVFPERYVVCVSRPEDSTMQYTKPLSTTTELCEQIRSEYFSREGEIQESFNCTTKIKKTVLQKIAKKANVQQEHRAPFVGKQQIEQRACVEYQREKHGDDHSDKSSSVNVSDAGRMAPENIGQQIPCSNVVIQNQGLTFQRQTATCSPDSINPNMPSVSFCPHEFNPGSRWSKRTKPGDPEDPRPLKANRAGLDGTPAKMQTHSTECFTQISKYNSLLLPPLPLDKTKEESKAFPVSEYKKTTVEVELLTPGKRDQRPPLTSNNTTQTNQNRLATSWRGLSVKLASSGSVITSRSTGGEEGSKNAPRTSRLRRLKRS